MINHPLEDREGSRRPPAGGVACGGSLGTEAFRVVGPCGVWKEEGLQRDDHSVGVLLDPRQLGYRCQGLWFLCGGHCGKAKAMRSQDGLF